MVVTGCIPLVFPSCLCLLPLLLVLAVSASPFMLTISCSFVLGISPQLPLRLDSLCLTCLPSLSSGKLRISGWTNSLLCSLLNRSLSQLFPQVSNLSYPFTSLALETTSPLLTPFLLCFRPIASVTLCPSPMTSQSPVFPMLDSLCLATSPQCFSKSSCLVFLSFKLC